MSVTGGCEPAVLKQFLSVAESAVFAGVSVNTIRRALAEKRLKAYRPAPRRVVVDRTELEAFVRGTAAV